MNPSDLAMVGELLARSRDNVARLRAIVEHRHADPTLLTDLDQLSVEIGNLAWAVQHHESTNGVRHRRPRPPAPVQSRDLQHNVPVRRFDLRGEPIDDDRHRS
jgi:hypothetical protein